ncbi:hypothetical protein ACFTWH_35365 [Streptomyces sp. NPDC057011]|uniref:hypothetical protein n=1 Tax=unclassified Streptomyces TaxID=2593676 RepID=UPI003641FB3C
MTAVNTGPAPAELRAHARCGAPPHTAVFGGPVALPPGGWEFAHAQCPVGELPSGGGFSVTSDRVRVNDSYLDDNRTWTVRATNTGTGPAELAARVICIPYA